MKNLIENKKIIPLIHISNAVWILDIFYTSIKSNYRPQNYWNNEVFILAILICIVLHVYRWLEISKISINQTFDSATSLKIALKEVADEMFGKTPYLFKISPNDHLLELKARETQKLTINFVSRNAKNLQDLIFDIKGYLVINFILTIIGGGFLYFGELPSYAQGFKSISFITPFALGLAGGFFIYGFATLVFAFFLNFSNKG